MLFIIFNRYFNILYLYNFYRSLELLKGCEEYLLKSQELGKLLRTLNGINSNIGKQFSENGDCLLHKLKYSERLKFVRRYIEQQKEKNKQQETTEKRRTYKKVHSPTQQNSA